MGVDLHEALKAFWNASESVITGVSAFTFVNELREDFLLFIFANLTVMGRLPLRCPPTNCASVGIQTYSNSMGCGSLQSAKQYHRHTRQRQRCRPRQRLYQARTFNTLASARRWVGGDASRVKNRRSVTAYYLWFDAADDEGVGFDEQGTPYMSIN
jgi:hypothetical protein